MDSNNFVARISDHYQQCWQTSGTALRWTQGPTHELPESFSVLLFRPTTSRKVWTYATCGMSLPTDPEPLELHIFAPQRSDQLVELLTAIAHYHRNSTFLGCGDTVNFGRPWMPGATCSYGLISLPYLDGPTLEWMRANGNSARFLWLIPITQAEVEYKKEHGLEALEEKLEEASFNYLNPTRVSVVL